MSVLDSFMPPTYPGSRQRKDAPRPEIRAKDNPFEGMKPRTYTVKGVEVEFFTVGQLAAALGRKAVTIRKWEHDGIIPRATFQAPNPKKDDRARRRLYSRAQAEGIVQIAVEEGLMISATKVSRTRFTERVIDLFRELM